MHRYAQDDSEAHTAHSVQLDQSRQSKVGLTCPRQLPQEGDYCRKASLYTIGFFPYSVIKKYNIQ